MTSRRLFLAKMVGLAGSTLLAKADYTKPLSLPVVLPRVEDYKGDSGKIVLNFPAIDFDRLLYCISEVETGHKDHLIGPSGERSRLQIKRSVWKQHMGGHRLVFTDSRRSRIADFNKDCQGELATLVARDHLQWLVNQLGAPASVYSLAFCWKEGFDAYRLSRSNRAFMSPAASGRIHRGHAYASKISNLYTDPTYRHT